MTTETLRKILACKSSAAVDVNADVASSKEDGYNRKWSHSENYNMEIRVSGVEALRTSMVNPARAWQGNKNSARDRFLQEAYFPVHHRPKFLIGPTDNPEGIFNPLYSAT
jgi:hypothetical protein